MSHYQAPTPAKTSSGQRPLLMLLLALPALVLLMRYVVVPVFDYPNKDFMTLWAGGRALIDGVDQYSPQGWVPLFHTYQSEWIPNETNPYPIWTSLLMLPFALFSVEWGAALWLAVCELLLAWILWQSAPRLYGRSLTQRELFWLFLAGFTSITNLLILINGQFTYFLLAVLCIVLLLEKQGHPFASGLVLTLLLLKPNPFVLFVPLVGLWLLLRRRWSMIAGGVLGGTLLLAVGEWVQRGWLTQWFAVRSKAVVVTITPTLWGLAAELSPDNWLWVGLALVIGFTAVLGWYIFTHPQLPFPAVIGMAAAGSLLVTPYGWSYEHALLFIPWLWLYIHVKPRRLAHWTFGLIAWAFPWLMFIIAAIRINDAFGGLVPLSTLMAVGYWSWHNDGKLAREQMNDVLS